MQSTELGYLNPDRSVTGVGAFGDGVTGGEVDGEPFDARVDLDGLIRTCSLYATDTLSIGDALDISPCPDATTARRRQPRPITPGGGPGSLDGDHAFGRFNPAAGVTFSPSRTLNVYGGYSEGSRARRRSSWAAPIRTSPASCRTRWPAIRRSIRSSPGPGRRACAATHRGINWNAGVFRADNHDDILFVTSDQTGFGYFKNFGETRRQGLELGADRRFGRVTIGAGYTFSTRPIESEETVNGESNSTNDAAEAGARARGRIEIEPGDRFR